MKFIKEYSGLVALVILAISAIFGSSGAQVLGSATNCTDGYTCFTNLEVQGNQIVDGTTAFVATTTFSDGLNLNNPGICINFYATSTATRVHFTASTTPTLPSGAAGVLTFDYGACAF